MQCATGNFFAANQKLSVEEIGAYRDGGTIFVALANQKSEKVPVCFDYQIGTLNRGRLFIGGTHSTDANAELVPLGDEVSGNVIHHLRQYLEESFAPAKLKELEVIADSSSKGSGANLNNEERKALMIIFCIKNLEALEK